MKGYIVKKPISLTGTFYQTVPEGTMLFHEARIEIDASRFPPIIILDKAKYERILTQGRSCLEEIEVNTEEIKELAKLKKQRSERLDHKRPTNELDEKIEERLYGLLKVINGDNNNNHK